MYSPQISKEQSTDASSCMCMCEREGNVWNHLINVSGARTGPGIAMDLMQGLIRLTSNLELQTILDKCDFCC